MDSQVAYVVPPGRDGWTAWAGTETRPTVPDQEWAQAFEAWLGAKSANTQRAYRRAWEDLLRFTGKRPCEVLSADLQDWAEDLRRRAVDRTVLIGLTRKGLRAAGDGHGLSASSIAQWLSAVSSFYRYVTEVCLVRTTEEGERPLHDHNPALAVGRPAVSRYAKSEYLSSAELATLLGAIPRRRPAGLRDYALFLGFVLTGRRNGEWRELRWGELRARGTQVWYSWDRRGAEGARNVIPPPLWEAMLAYLEAAGRLGGMKAGDYLFCPLSDHATRLPNVDAGSWVRNRPLSAGTVNQKLKRYARRAGIDPRRVHVHVLRHSAAMLEEETGASLAEISRFLGHADPKRTMRYLDQLRGQGDGTWQRKAELLGISAGR